MWVCACFVWFVVYSVFGWVYESAYCTIKERHWENRGFLYGPVCPIYGTGIVAMMALWQLTLAQGMSVAWWQVFVVAMAGSAVLEYGTHWALEKLFHARWWDYSDMPLNLNGRICLPASVFFGIGGLVVVYVLFEPTVSFTKQVSGVLMELISLVFMAIIAADTAITVSALTRIAHMASAINRGVNDHMEQFVANAVERGAAAAEYAQDRREEAEQAIAEERERFAAALRDTRLGEMSHLARSAVRRARALAPSVQTPQLPDIEQLRQLLDDVKARHWPRV